MPEDTDKRIEELQVRNACLERRERAARNHNHHLVETLREIAKRGANPITQYGYGKERPWSRLADDIWDLAESAIKLHGKDVLEDGARWYLVVGRVPDEEDAMGVVKMFPGDLRTPWGVFVEETLHGGVMSDEVYEDLRQETGSDRPEIDNLLPPDWAGRDPTHTESRHGSWGYCEVCVEISGPPLGDNTGMIQ